MNFTNFSPLSPATLTETVLLTLLDAAAKSVVLLCVAGVACWTLRRASAATRHLVWLAALSAALVLPALSFCLPQWRVLPAWMDLGGGTGFAEILSAASPATSAAQRGLQTERMPTVNEPTDAIVGPPGELASIGEVSQVGRPLPLVAIGLSIVWACGAGVLVLRLARSAWALHRLSRSLRAVVEGPLAAATEQIAQELGSRTPLLLVGAAEAMPMAWGIGRGRLLLPTEATAWDARRLRAVLLHELAHLRRRDPLTQAVAQLALALHWFNPLAWLAVHCLRAEQERACDDYVLRGGVSPGDYARSVLDLATRLDPAPIAATVALAMAERTRIEGRLQTILDAGRNRRGLSRAVAVLTVLLVGSAALTLTMLHAADEQPTGGKVAIYRAEFEARRVLVQGRIDASYDLVVRIDRKEKPLEWRTGGRDGEFEVVVEASDAIRLEGNKTGHGFVVTVKQNTSQSVTNVSLTDGDPVAGRFTLRRESDLAKRDGVLTLADIALADGTKAPVTLVLEPSAGATRPRASLVLKPKPGAELEKRTQVLEHPAVNSAEGAAPTQEPDKKQENLAEPADGADAQKTIDELIEEFANAAYLWRQGEVARELVALGDVKIVPRLEKYLDAEDRTVRCNAALVLAGLGDERGLAILIGELKDTSPRPTSLTRSDGAPNPQGQIRDDRYYAALLLGQLGAKQAVPALIEATADETIHYRAAISLGEIGDDRAIPALRKMLKDFPAQRLWAGYGLAALGEPEGFEILTEVALSDAKWTQRRHAVEALGKVGSFKAVPTLVKALKDQHANVRVGAATALGQIGDPAALPALTEALGDTTTTEVNAPTTVADEARKAIDAIGNK